MKDIEQKVEEFLARMDAERPEIDRILRERQPLIETGREQKNLLHDPKELDFTERDGNTEYEVVGHFASDGNEAVINKVLRKLGYSFHD